MDNMRVHHSGVSKQAYESLKIIPVFNIAYSPQFNPIESVFSMVKAKYKKLLLKTLIDKKRPKPKQLIIEAIGSLEIEKIRKCIAHGIKELSD